MKNPHNEFRVTGTERGLSIVDYLSRRLGISKKKAKQMLDARIVFVNNRRVWMARHELVTNDIVEVQASAPAARPAPAALHILYQDSDYVIIDKPPGMMSNGANSAESRLREQTGNTDIEAVHRLDRDTSGCLIFQKMQRRGTRSFQLSKIGRSRRRTTPSSGQLQGGPRVIDEPVDNQQARTRVRMIRSNNAASYLELKPETGRTHQLREHVAGIRHAILGDRVYATKAIDLPVLRAVPRQMLHATAIEFAHPLTKALIRATAREPGDFTTVRRALKLL